MTSPNKIANATDSRSSVIMAQSTPSLNVPRSQGLTCRAKTICEKENYKYMYTCL